MNRSTQIQFLRFGTTGSFPASIYRLDDLKKTVEHCERLHHQDNVNMVQQTNMTLEEKAGQLLRRLTDGYHQTYGVGSMTCAIYDTAWVAMVAKTVNGRTQWLFPDSFRHLLDHQLPNGGWESYASEVDGILNTMAALLALCKHVANPYQLAGQMPPDMASRLSRATEFLRAQLQQWDVGSTVHVGFEILIPTLLDLLEEAGITFDFKQRHLLMAIRDIKMSKFNVSVLYKNISMTALHSLEAFIGKIDFDRVSHHTVSGSMMGSPSSTAAYLIHRSTWDEESEAYLWHVITAGEGRGNGGVPSAFPSTLFEITWVCDIDAELFIEHRSTDIGTRFYQHSLRVGLPVKLLVLIDWSCLQTSWRHHSLLKRVSLGLVDIFQRRRGYVADFMVFSAACGCRRRRHS